MKWWIYAYVASVTLPLISAGSYLRTAGPTTQNKNVYEQDPAVGQLPEWAATNNNVTCIRTADGRPEDSETASLRAGRYGPLAILDTIFFQLHGRFNRQRIPPRVVHAKGAGAFGYFQVTKDITQFCRASVFAKVGEKFLTKVRFSIAGPSLPGQSDVQREVRGFATKICTKDGTWDLVGNNVPVFFISDGIKFPSLIHTQGRNPVTNLRDPNSFWDFATKSNDTLFTLLYRFSYYGLPRNFRTMNGHGVNTFKLVNGTGDVVYCKFHWMTDQGVQSLTPEESDELAATDPDHSTRDLYNTIHKGQYPSWTLHIQVMTIQQANNVSFDPFDASLAWPIKDFPLHEVGKLVLNKNPENYFEEIEKLAYCPSHMVPGIEASPDILLQARLFAYENTQQYRLGVNFFQLPANICPFFTSTIKNYQVDGHFVEYYAKGDPNYYPNSYHGPVPCACGKISEFDVCGTVRRYEKSEDNYNFDQQRAFWQSLSAKDQNDTIAAIVLSGRQAAYYIQERIINYFAPVDKTMASKIETGLKNADTAKPPPPPTEEI